MALVIPPEGLFRDGEFPEDEMVIPASLWKPIREWHERLGIPSADQESPSKTPVQYPKLKLDREMKAAYYRYDKALHKLLIEIGVSDFDGNYGRFPEKALRISAIFASLAGSSTITTNHWAKAQAIAERWRRNLHEAYNQVNQVPRKKERMSDLEKVRAAFIEKTNPTKREIEQFTGFSAAVVEKIL